MHQDDQTTFVVPNFDGFAVRALDSLTFHAIPLIGSRTNHEIMTLVDDQCASPPETHVIRIGHLECSFWLPLFHRLYRGCFALLCCCSGIPPHMIALVRVSCPDSSSCVQQLHTVLLVPLSTSYATRSQTCDLKMAWCSLDSRRGHIPNSDRNSSRLPRSLHELL